jgi:hypothetical protein
MHIPGCAILQNLCHDFALPPFEDRGGKFSNGLFIEFVESNVLVFLSCSFQLKIMVDCLKRIHLYC